MCGYDLLDPSVRDASLFKETLDRRAVGSWELQQEQALILDHVPALIWYKDTSNRLIRVNAAVARSLGLPKEQIEGRHTSELYPEEADRYYQDDLIVIQTGEPRLGIIEPQRLPSGERRWIRTDKIPLRDASGQITGILVMSLDITTQQETEEALREADRRKDEFLAILAHELRNPLAPIRNATEILRMVLADDTTLTWCRNLIERQVEHLTQLVDDLLDISRINRGRIEIRSVPLSMTDVVERAIETSRPLIDARRHSFSVTVPREPLRVEGDLIRLAQVVSNLLHNAAKFTEPGGRIQLSVEPDGSEVVLCVRDTGIGISPAMIDSIFEMFVQADSSRNNSRGGLGIGLSLARQLVTLHGGTLTAISAGEGMGSEFVVRLPHLVTSLAASATTGADDAARRHRILVADDNADVADSLSMLLNLLGQEVRIARDGVEAVEIAATFRPDLILLDLGMPRLDGYGACQRLRAELADPNVVIAALSGWGQPQDKAATEAAGFDHHLVKPASLPDLQHLLESLS
ncbi:PAS domain S-box-containing protein [Thiobaca trueperi]|uniref:histidine kinase n=1 Tax=Thiobaca trueperi TaxID=127458 RepID=A0A4R3N6L7_9GAMM|nr:PAS domain S-box-containing protein [Thiobaca trueperi]